MNNKNRIIVNADRKKSLDLYHKAAKQNSIDALDILTGLYAGNDRRFKNIKIS